MVDQSCGPSRPSRRPSIGSGQKKTARAQQQQQAAQQLPDQVDHEEHGDLLQQYGVDPNQLAASGGGQGMGGGGYEQQQGGGGYDQEQGGGYEQDGGDPGYQ